MMMGSDDENPSTSFQQPLIVKLRVADALWGMFIVWPLLIIYWSGTWKLMDTYVLPEPGLGGSLKGFILCYMVGLVIGLLGYLVLPLIKQKIEVRCSAQHIIVSRLILYLINLAYVSYWRGVWLLTDHFIGTDWLKSIYCLIPALFLLCLFQASTNALAVPFSIFLDTRNSFYDVQPAFRSRPESSVRFIIDAFISHAIITHLCVQVWRASWNLYDHFIYPEHEDLWKSYTINLSVGYVVAIMLFALQFPINILARRLSERHRLVELVFFDLYNVVVIATNVSLWRGGWGFFKDYWLTEVWQFWAAHFGGTAALMLALVSSSVAFVGISKDAELPGGAWAFFPNQYFTVLHREKLLPERNIASIHDKHRPSRQGLLASDSESDDVLIN